eukprot:jgi/Mesvir1/15467/Mv25873-RA.1
MALPKNEYKFSIPVPSRRRSLLFRLWHPCSEKSTWQPTERRGLSFPNLFRTNQNASEKQSENQTKRRRFSASDAQPSWPSSIRGQTAGLATGVYPNGAWDGPHVEARQELERHGSGRLVMRPVSHNAPVKTALSLGRVDSFYQPNSARSEMGSLVRVLCDGDEEINIQYSKSEYSLSQRRYMHAADGYERCLSLMSVYPVEKFLGDRAHCLRRLARVYESVHDTSTAEEYLTFALRVLGRVEDAAAELEKAGCYSQLGVVKKMEYDYAAGAKNFKLAQEIYEDHVGDDDPRLLFVLNARAECLGRIGAIKPALEIATRVVGLARSVRSHHLPRFEKNLALVQGLHRMYGDYVDMIAPMEAVRQGSKPATQAQAQGVGQGPRRLRPASLQVESIEEAKTPTATSPDKEEGQGRCSGTGHMLQD